MKKEQVARTSSTYTPYSTFPEPAPGSVPLQQIQIAKLQRMKRHAVKKS